MSNKAGVASIPGSGHGGGYYQSPTMYAAAYGRVYKVLLTEDKKLADEMGVPVGTLGAIQFRYLVNDVVNEQTPTQTALHFDSHSRRFPLENEIVELVSGPAPAASNAKGNNIPTIYYKTIIDLWDSAEHNAIPDNSFNTKEGPVTGKDFAEKGDIARLQHLPGDKIEEGRFGNSVRIGSSNKSIPNVPWSGPDGSPVYIIRNRQSKDLPKGTKITLEDINTDGTSLYFLSDQTIGFNPASYNFDSYGEDITPAAKHKIVTTVPTPPPPPGVPTVVADAVATKDQTDVAPVVYDTQVKPVVAEDEISFLPDREPPVYYQELEDLIIGDTNYQTAVSIKPEYTITERPTLKGSSYTVNRSKIQSSVRGVFAHLPFKSYTPTPKSISDFVKELSTLVSSGTLDLNVARSILAIAKNEQGGTRGFGYNFFGAHSDIGAFSTAGKFNNSKPDHQELAKEHSSQTMRAYLGFPDFKTSLLYIADVLYSKGFNSIPYDASDVDRFTQLYISKWWSPGNISISAEVYKEKSSGYAQAKNMIK